MKSKSNIVLVLVFITGLSLLLYPTVSDAWNSHHATQVISNYLESVSDIDDEAYEQMLANAKAYNASLVNSQNGFASGNDGNKTYNSLLDVSGTGVMGVVNIPKINVSLPIYHGTEDSVLQVGVGHLEGSSLPVGGESTHCVISGHRGLPSARLFTDIDELEAGDTFTITVLDEMLTYEVDQILIVLPEEVNALEIVEGADLCTLVTCTPYGINTHRLLVRGHRIETKDTGGIRIEADGTRVDSMLVALAIAVPILIALLIWMLFSTRKKKGKDASDEEKEYRDDNIDSSHL